MTKPLSGVLMAERIANGTATEAEKQQVKKANQERKSIWDKKQQAKTEYKRGMAIEFEKERRVKAGLPEYDIQQSAPNPDAKPVKGSKSRKKTYKSASQILKEQQGSEAKGKMMSESAAKAKIAKAEHNAKTNPNANEKKVHKELKNAERMSPGSTANVNEKELIETIEKNKAAANKVTPAAAEETGKALESTAKSGSKISKYLKKGGKIGAALLVIGGLIYGAKKLFGGGDDDKKTQADTPVKEQKDTPATPADKTTEPAKGSDGGTTPAPVGSDSPTQPAKGEEKADDKANKPVDKKDPAKVAPAPVSGDDTKADKTDKSDKSDKSDKAEDKNRALPKNYTVKKGDNVWNIAKRRLQEVNGKKPTDKEIMNYTKELLKLNKLEYEADGYTVIIHKGDNIEYAA